MLSALPQSHSGAVAFTFYALLAGLPLIALTDRDPASMGRATAKYRPTTVIAFHPTYAALATSDPDPTDFSSVGEWMNTGDSAHEAHIRKLTRLGEHTVDGDVVPGSVFGDALGASELGWAALRRVVTNETPYNPRYLGRPVGIATVVVLRRDGTLADDDEVGLLGVRSDSVSPGFWNDSDTTYRSRLSGYQLTGDLAYRTGDDDFFHLDRAVDAIETDEGMGYSLLMEEVIMHLPEVADCAVCAGRYRDRTVPVGIVRLTSEGVSPQSVLQQANVKLREIGQPQLGLLEVATSESDIPVGPTEKVLKRTLRERYGDLSAYMTVRGSGIATINGLGGS